MKLTCAIASSSSSLETSRSVLLKDGCFLIGKNFVCWLGLLGFLAKRVIFLVAREVEGVGAGVFFGIGGMLFRGCRLV